jgi:hypothetical protein
MFRTLESSRVARRFNATAREESCVMPIRSIAMWSTLLITLAPGSAIAAPLSGTFSSPLGPVSLTETDGTVIGKVVDAKKNPCGFPKGTVILEGSRLDDSVVGTVHACKVVSDTCAGPLDGAAMLLITRGGAVISGAVHLEAGACTTPLKGDSVVFRKGPEKKATNASTAAADAKKGGTPRQRAEALATEANKIMNENEGNAEAARAKFQEAVQIDPTYSEGYIGVGVTYYARERYDEALDWYKKALEANPANGDAYYNTGCVYALKGDKEQALRYLKIALLNGYVQLDSLKKDPDLKKLEGDPTFEKLKTGVTD